jgi:hypothetical protein
VDPERAGTADCGAATVVLGTSEVCICSIDCRPALKHHEWSRTRGDRAPELKDRRDQPQS